MRAAPRGVVAGVAQRSTQQEESKWSEITSALAFDFNDQFASSGLAFGFGRELAYVAQLIQQDLSYSAYKKYKDVEGLNLGLVVAAAYSYSESGNRWLIIGINCNDLYVDGVRAALEEHESAIRTFTCDELGSKVRILFDERLSYGGRLKALKVEPAVLHAEQKVIGYIEDKKLEPAVNEIGIAHVRGPCSQETAGSGSQDCGEYLEAKKWVGVWLKDRKFGQKKGLPSSIWEYQKKK